MIYGRTSEQNFSGVKFEIFPTYYHTWGCPVFFLEASLQGGQAGLPKWKSRAITRVYLGHYPFNAGSVSLVLKTRAGNVYPQYHVVFDNTLSTVDHIRKVKVPGNWKNLVEEHSELSMQEKSTLAKK